MEFIPFPKIPRLSREIVITEKIDGTNACVHVFDATAYSKEWLDENGCLTVWLNEVQYAIRAGSRTRWIRPGDDNYGFAFWVLENLISLVHLGPGTHFGEWWGSGIQRGYGLSKGEKRFSLFNTSRWGDDAVRPACCHVVPTLYRGEFNNDAVEHALSCLRGLGSYAAPGFPRPEGIIVFHTAGNLMFKKTLHKDDEWKGKAA